MKNIKILFYVLILAFSFNSCELNDESTIDGHDITGSPEIIGWSQKSFTESYFSDLGTIDKNYALKVFNGADNAMLSKDVVVNVSVIEAESSATEGVDGEFILNTPNVTFNAGSDFVNVSLGINTGNFNPNEPTSVVLLLETSTGGVVISSLTKKMTLTFVGCASDLVGVYSTGTLTKFDDVFYHSPAMPGIQYTSGNPVFFEFKDICGDLTITNTDLGSGYPVGQPEAGYVDETNGNIIFPSVSLGTLSFYQNIEVVLVKQ